MKTKLTKLLFALFAVMVGTSVNAQTSGSCGDNATWSYDEGVLTISGTGAMDDYSVESIITPWKDYTTNITKIVIGDGITHVGNFAFNLCTGLTSVTIGKGVETIGNGAFDNCTNTGFTKLNIPDNVKSIGIFACSNNHLKYLCLGSGLKSIGNFAFDNCQDLQYIGCYALTPPTVGTSAFAGVTPTAIYVDNYCKSTFQSADGWSAFSEIIQTPYGYCGAGDGDDPTDAVSWGYSLMDRTLSFSGSGAIKDFSTMGGPNAYPWNNPAFNPKGGEYDMYWTGIEKIQMNKNITTIPDWAFAMQINCGSISLPSKLTSIGASALEECAFTSIDLPEGLETIDMYAFYGSKLTSVLFPSTLTSIGADAFLDNDDLAIITSARVTPPTCTDGAFGDGSTITAIYVPEGCTDTYKAAEGWSTYEAKIFDAPNTTFTYTATEKIAKFDDNLDRFEGAMSVKSHEFDGTNGTVVYEGYVTGLGELALSYAKMTSITIPASVTSIGSGAFQSSKLTSVTLAGTTALKTIGTRAFSSCSALTAFTVPATVTSIGASAFSGCSALETFTFDGTPTVASIGNAAFQDCKKLTSFTIPESVTTLGRTVFWFTGLTSLNIPAGVTSIGQALYCASPVTSLTIDAANPKYADLGCNGVFEKDKNKLIAGGAATTIPDGITTIGQEAFWGEEGEFSLFLPESVTTIEERAFHMARGLKALTIPSGITYIDEECFFFCEGTQDVYCYVDAADMTWDGGMDMPAFIMDPAKSTQFHVTDADAWSTKFPDANVTFVGDLNIFTLSENLDNTAVISGRDGHTATVTLTRTLKAGGWNTFAVPFNIASADLTNAGITAVKKLTSSSFAGGVLTLNFENASSIEAGKPYLVKVDADKDLSSVSFTQIKINKDIVPTVTTAADFVPTLGKTLVSGPEGNEDDVKSVLILGAANTLYYPSVVNDADDETCYMKGFRAYFQLKGTAASAASFNIDLGDGETTGVIDVRSKTEDVRSVYDLQGRKVLNANQKGIYIQNGKKVIIK